MCLLLEYGFSKYMVLDEFLREVCFLLISNQYTFPSS